MKIQKQIPINTESFSFRANRSVHRNSSVFPNTTNEDEIIEFLEGKGFVRDTTKSYNDFRNVLNGKYRYYVSNEDREDGHWIRFWWDFRKQYWFFIRTGGHGGGNHGYNDGFSYIESASVSDFAEEVNRYFGWC